MQLRLASVLLACSLVARAARADAPAPPPAEEVAPPHLRLAGTYVFVGGEKEVAAKDQAIDKATEDMFFAIKGVARSKLREKVPIRPSVAIAFANGTVTVREAGALPASSPVNGTPVASKNSDGDPVKITHRVTPDGKLTQVIAAENGLRAVTFALARDGKTLVCAVSVESSKLPKPVRYTLTYRRS